MTVSDAEVNRYTIQHKLEPPEGGWGYIVAIAMALMFVVTVGPLVAFGIIFGKYLSTIGDEASATAIINCIFNTVTNFMGLVANHLLQRRSCRFVGIIGSMSFFLGCCLTTFANSEIQIILTFGILQGIGFGLMLSATLTSFNQYFIRRKNFIMGISQTIFSAAVMVIPYFARILIDEYGYRGTLAIISAFSLHTLIAMISLQPVEWHMNKVPVSAIEMSFLPPEKCKIDDNYIKKEEYSHEISSPKGIEKQEGSKIWAAISKFFELSLLKDLSFVNICVGVSLGFMSDIMFISLVPMFLYHSGYSQDEIAYLMTAYMAADLCGRLSFSMISAVIKIKNRTWFMWGCAINAIIRIVFTLHSESWLWVLIIIIMLGLTRCLLQVTIPLVFAEYSQTKFPAAFGLYLAICGIISLASGQISSLVASYTTGDAWVQHVLTLQLLLCFIFWIIEMICNTFRK